MRGREITGRDDAARLAGHPGAADDGTGLQKVGFAFIGTVMLVEVKVTR